MSWGWQPSTLQTTDCAVPRISLTVPENSLAKDQCHICWAILIISSKVMFPLCLVFFCFFLSLGSSWELWWSGQRQKNHLNQGLSLLSGQFHCNPQTLPIAIPLTMSLPTFFWRQIQGANLGGQDRCGTDFSTGAPQVCDFNLTGVWLLWHGGGGWCQKNPNLGWPKKVAPWPPPSRKKKSSSCF